VVPSGRSTDALPRSFPPRPNPHAAARERMARRHVGAGRGSGSARHRANALPPARSRKRNRHSVAAVEQPIAGAARSRSIYRAPGMPRGARDRWMTVPEIERSASPADAKIVRRIAAGSDRRTIAR
jgi:hypothetical protein